MHGDGAETGVVGVQKVVVKSVDQNCGGMGGSHGGGGGGVHMTKMEGNTVSTK